ncbi:MAG: hypothetical protein AABW83_04390 [Nanoarchaeota archaeon]
MASQTKVITRRKKFQEVEIPLLKTKIELIGDSISEIENKNIKLDLTRQLKGKSLELVIKVINIKNKASAIPIKLKLMPYFIRRMIRKKISYVEDSLLIPSQENMLLVKPFLITRKRVSRAVRKALRNRAKNWIGDYISQLNNEEIFEDILSNKLQKNLSLILKKTYPLSLCEIRILEVKRILENSEVPKKLEKKEIEETVEDKGFIDQIAEIEEEMIKKAEEDMKKTQIEAVKKEKEVESEEKKEIKEVENIEENNENLEKKTKKTRKKKEKEKND